MLVVGHGPVHLAQARPQALQHAARVRRDLAGGSIEHTVRRRTEGTVPPRARVWWQGRETERQTFASGVPGRKVISRQKHLAATGAAAHERTAQQRTP